MVNLSFIIITQNRLEKLKRCLQSIQTYKGKLSFEILVLTNGSDPKTESYLKGLKEDRLQAFFYDESVTPAKARNALIRTGAQGEWIVFIDDDAYLSECYFKTLEQNWEEVKKFEIFGGPDETPKDARGVSKVLGLALKSPLATAKTRYRHNVSVSKIKNPSETVFTLCNLAINRELFFSSHEWFREDFKRNEENEYLLRAAKHEHRMIFIPDLLVYHYRRSNPFKIFWSIFLSGFYRYKMMNQMSWFNGILFSFPSLAIITLFVMPFFSVRGTATLILSYMVLNLLYSLQISIMRREYYLVAPLFLMQVLILIAYGMGMIASAIRGLLQVRFHREESQSNV